MKDIRIKIQYCFITNTTVAIFVDDKLSSIIALSQYAEKGVDPNLGSLHRYVAVVVNESR